MIESLSFDTEFFGVRVGRVRGPVSDAGELAREARAFDLLYLAGANLESLPLGAIAGTVGVIDLRLDLRRGATRADAPRDVTDLDDGTLAAAEEIAAEAFRVSRFFREPRLEARAPELYRLWVRKGHAGRAERSGVLAARGGAALDGFLVYRGDGDAQRIDLIASAASARGKGVGRALVDALSARFPERETRVRVSADNPRALDFYLQVGFRPRESDVVVHLWPERT